MPAIKKRQAATMGLISALGPFQFDMYLPALPALILYFSTTETMVQLTITASLLGMAFGQVLVGPITDALGRRRPLIIALSVFIVASLACLSAADVTWMVIARFILGFSAAAGFVIVNAFIRDMATGDNAAKLYSTQAAISSLAPVVAPLVGGQLLLFGDWHIVFIFLAFMGAAVMAFVAAYLPESLPIESRSELSFKATFTAWGHVLRDSRFVVLILLGGLLFGSVASFIAGAPFALQQGFGLTPTEYTYAFAMVTVIMFGANSLNRYLLKYVSSISLMRYGLAQALLAAAVMITINVFEIHSLVLTIVGYALAVSVMGFTMANIMGMAMREHAERAGVAAGLNGFATSLFGAMAAPLTSIVFGADVQGVGTFMSILLIAAALLGFFGLRNEVPVRH
ncbi:multidrug effflux MFS transporter [Rhodoluna limnophila]|uniref:multidrug effflux MFS transporter n=1 Tax=Rhodoluna limnophila TaxID=232537 RepID=UPI001562858B|nr:multidrug effflux MFS transporter [Rhodoluna limnophila]